MRSLFLTITTTIILLSSSAFTSAQSQKAYEIKVQVKGVKDSTIQLAYYYADKKLLKDSAVADSKGNFTFKGEEALDQGVYLIVMPGSRYFEFIANETQHFSLTTDTSNYVNNMVIKGNEENEFFYEYLQFITPNGQKINELTTQYREVIKKDSAAAEKIKEEAITIDKSIKDYRKNFITTHKDQLVGKLLQSMEEVEIPDFKEITDNDKRRAKQFAYYKEHYFDYLDLSDDRMLRTPVFHPKVEKYIDKYTAQTPDSLIKEADRLMKMTGDNYQMFKYMLIYITGKYEKSKIMCLDEVPYHMFSEYFLKDERVDWIDSTTRRKIQEEVVKTQYNLCGDVAQEISFADTNGVYHSLSELKSKYTLVYFYSATCGHCKKATPKLLTIYNRIKDEYNFEVFSVCIDKEDKEYKKFINKHSYSWINTRAPSNIGYFREKYNVYSTPTIYLLNENKEIIAKKIDVGSIEKILADLEGKELSPEAKAEMEEAKENDHDHEGHDH